MASTKQNRGPGFLFGVALGTVVGAGALVFAGGKETNKIRSKLKTKIDDTLDNIKTKYPQESSQVEDVLHKALSEAQQKSEEIKKEASSATKKAKTSKKSILATLSEKRTFTRKGKPLASD